MCSSQRGDADAAIHAGFKAIEIANSLQSTGSSSFIGLLSGGDGDGGDGDGDGGNDGNGNGGNRDASAVPSNPMSLVVISCLLLLSDAYKQKNGKFAIVIGGGGGGGGGGCGCGCGCGGGGGGGTDGWCISSE